MRKKNILDRLTELEIITNEKDEKINFLVSKNDKLCALLEKLTVTDSNTYESSSVIPAQVKDLNCEKCDFVAKSEAGLKLHTQAKHTKQSKFKCKTCDFTCESKELLSTHNANPCPSFK